MAQTFAVQIRGNKSGRANLHEEAARVEASRLVRVYESHEFDLAGAISSPTSIRTIVTHSSGCSCARTSGAFGLITRAQRVAIRNVGQAGGSAGPVTVRIVGLVTDQTNIDLVTVDPGEYADWNMMEIEDILFTTPGVATRVRVLMA